MKGKTLIFALTFIVCGGTNSTPTQETTTTTEQETTTTTEQETTTTVSYTHLTLPTKRIV